MRCGSDSRDERCEDVDEELGGVHLERWACVKRRKAINESGSGVYRTRKERHRRTKLGKDETRNEGLGQGRGRRR
jgi:hypothetical protein